MSQNPATQPLHNRRIVVTRACSQAASLSSRLQQAGAEAIELPMIEFRRIAWTDPPSVVKQRIGAFDWIVFTSSNGVRFFFDLLPDFTIPSHVRLACVGPRTAAELTRIGRGPAFVPSIHSGQQLAAEMPLEAGQSVLYPGPRKVAPGLTTGLQSRGARVERWAVYETVGTQLPQHRLRLLESEIDAITFASPSAVESFVRQFRPPMRLFPGCLIACIGPATARCASQRGLNVDIVSRDYNTESLIEALISRLKKPEAEHGQ